jgi:2-polyprenyl-6-methoxyphenol hydroxylase-like FAD-dependent oxidoreductase
MSDVDVVVVGGGPTGLMLAAELGLLGVDAVVLERLAEPSGESRAGGLHARTMEVLDQRGLLGPFLERGRRIDGAHFSGIALDLTGVRTRHPYLLALLQRHVERLLEARVAELGVPVRREVEVTGLVQDADGVRVGTADGARLRARYVVGCDGGRSTVRRLAGIDFPGTPATLTALLGDVELAEPPAESIFQERRAGGNFSVLGFEPGWWRVMTTEFDGPPPATAPDLDELRATMLRVAGTDFGMHSPRWVSRYGDAARQADRYRSGRVLLAGDAAHVHHPAGGQGLNTGVQDAVNLGWKLAAVTRGGVDPGAADDLLDSYHAERHPVAARVLQNTRAQTALSRPDPQTAALRESVAAMIATAGVNRELALMITALDLRYPVGGPAHPLLGLRAPDVGLTTGAGRTRLHELLHAARPVLLDLTGGAVPAAEGWADRVDVVAAVPADPVWTVPVAGAVPAPDALLVRPDGHVAWVGGADDAEPLRAALTRWCGPAGSRR